MAAYAIGILTNVSIGPGIVEYLEQIDDTLRPHDGRFAVHGAPNEVREGTDPGTVVIIEFPNIAAARRWYDSPEYQAILRLRADNSTSTVILVDGVEAGHLATDVLRPEVG
jgi:uncharacterized protein (DUF1330 family)